MNEYDYIIDAFTRDGNNTNLEVDNLHVGCITSKNNNFEIDSQGNLTIQSINTNSIPTLVDYFYPVGSIYMTDQNINPSTIFGGTWEQLKDKFLLGAGDTYTAGSTGGEATHKLTVSEMPSHTHHIRGMNGSGGTERYPLRIASGTPNWDTWSDPLSTGGDQAHNNMPPYLTVYMWRRVS